MKSYSLIQFLSLFLILSLKNNLNASHKMGADMYYIHLGADKYKFITKFYRDCIGIPFNNPEIVLEIGSSEGRGDCGSFNLSSYSTRVAINDVTQICSDSSLPCSPQNTTIPNVSGVEEHIYETIVDFGSSQYSSILNSNSCKVITVSFSQCCRNGDLTNVTPGGFFVFTTLYWKNMLKTRKKENNSVQFTNTPIIYACCNVPFSLSQCAIDTLDNDSVSFRLVPGLDAANSIISYNSPFTSQIPLTPYCPPNPSTVNCRPMPNASPPRGFYFDIKTGDIVFTPTNCQEVGIVVIEANEYRKDSFGNILQVSKTRRDMEVIVKSCGQNTSPNIIGSNYFTICEGQKICFDILVKDSSANTKDSLILTWNDDMKGNTVTTTYSSAKNKKVEVCWTTKVGDSKNYPYLFSLTASDNVCPYPIKVSKTFMVQVKNCLSNSQVNHSKELNLIVYPNPAQNVFSVITKVNQCQLTLIDVNGKQVMELNNYTSGELINAEGLSQGIYTIKCTFDNYSLFETLLLK